VQVRQNTDHKRTFLYLEQLILKYNAHAQSINVEDMPDGLDFYFAHKSHAQKFVDFLQSVAVVRYKTAEQLVSHDARSNIYNYHYTFSVEISPVCREDLVCLPKKYSNYMGNICPLVVCTKVSTLLHFIDPDTLKTGEINGGLYWQTPFRSLAIAKQMTEYIVLDITAQGGTGTSSKGKYLLSNITVARTRDFGNNDTVFLARTHLGHILKPGDYALGYDLTNLNFASDAMQAMRGREIPDVVIVKKHYVESRQKNASMQRHWDLKTIEKTIGEGRAGKQNNKKKKV